jgi:hypothetical protein
LSSSSRLRPLIDAAWPHPPLHRHHAFERPARMQGVDPPTALRRLHLLRRGGKHLMASSQNAVANEQNPFKTLQSRGEGRQCAEDSGCFYSG